MHVLQLERIFSSSTNNPILFYQQPNSTVPLMFFPWTEALEYALSYVAGTDSAYQKGKDQVVQLDSWHPRDRIFIWI
jgi:hypothetical protein